MQLNHNHEIEILELDNNKKRKVKKHLKFKKIFIPLIIVLVFSIIALSNVTKENSLIKTNTKKIFENIGIYTQENRNVNINNEQKSWNIEKNIKWIDSKKVKITYDLTSVSNYEKNNKDIVIMIDTSKSMSNGKLEQIKVNTINLIDEILKEDNNRIALISFNQDADLLTSFTNEKDVLVEKINSLSVNGSSDYKEPYKVLNKILLNNNEKDISVLLVVGGYSNVKVNKTLYNILKTNYSHITINGIQYEMGSNTNELSKCTDNQIIADKNNLYERMYEAIYPINKYDTLMIDEYLTDNFKLNSKNDITVTNGKLNINNDNNAIITWDLSKNYVIGSHEQMNIIVSLNDENDKEKYYPVTKKTQVQTDNEKIISNKALVLKNFYEVDYDVNTPKGCKLDNPKSQKHFVYTSVTNDDNKLECDGYLFKGWKTTENVEKINDNTFVMPDKDILVRGTWTKQMITKTMDGEVFEKTTLYKTLKEESEKKNSFIQKYNGDHNDSINEEKSTEDIYYFHAKNEDEANMILEKNNVLFADICWQILRTTDTGGIKLIYNGKPDKNGSCSLNRDNQVGYDIRIVQNISNNNYYYGTEYTYDENSKMFKLSKDIKQFVWNNKTSEEIVGKYTCMSEKENDECPNLYYVESYIDNEKANLIPSNSTTNYSVIGISNYNKSNTSLAYIGYMYGDIYKYDKVNIINEEQFVKEEQFNEVIVGDSIIEENGIYILQNPINVTKDEWKNDYSKYIGKYTCNSELEQCNNPRIIINTTEHNYSYIDINENITVSKEISNGNLQNSISIKKYELIKNRDKYLDYKYTCNDNNTKCNNIRYITDITNNGYKYTTNKFYGEKVLWNGKKYILQNTIGMEKYSDLSNNHYMCLENNSKECDKVAYIYYYDDNKVAYYILLENGKVSNIDEALDSMIKNNSNDSEIKTIIEAWYEKNLINYQEYLEDTIYCNNRTINKDELSGWNIKGNINSLIKFKENSPEDDLKCDNPTDQFSINNEIAKIKYPIGLPTKTEMNLLNSDILRKTKQTYWLSSPYSYKDTSEQYQIREDGKITYSDLIQNSGIRPVISLKEKIEFTEGNGSMELPYVIEEKEN